MMISLILNGVLGVLVMGLFVHTQRQRKKIKVLIQPNLKTYVPLTELIVQLNLIISEIMEDRILVMRMGKKTLVDVEAEILRMTEDLYLMVSPHLKNNLLMWVSEDYILYHIQSYVRNSLVSYQMKSVQN